MGDLLNQGGGSLPPNLGSDPTQAAAAAQQMGQMGQQQPGGITGFLSNPLFQGALGAYLGAVGSPRDKGLGGAIMSGGLTGLNAFNQAQQQRLEMPLKQAQMQEAQLTAKKLGMDLKPLTKEEIQSITDWKTSLTDRQKADPTSVDPYEISFVNQLEGQMRAGTITHHDLLTTMNAFHESNIMQQLLRGQMYAGGQRLAAQLPGMSGLLNQGQGQQGQPQPPAQQPVDTGWHPKDPTIYQGLPIPPAGQKPALMNVPSLGEVYVGINPADGNPYYLPKDYKGKTWAPLP
jgi:hypothetical protein